MRGSVLSRGAAVQVGQVHMGGCVHVRGAQTRYKPVFWKLKCNNGLQLCVRKCLFLLVFLRADCVALKAQGWIEHRM